MTRVLLIRHGETPWNRERRWQGHADIELTPLGVEQADRLARYLSEHGPVPQTVYSSDLSRARETASRLAAACAAALVPDPAWREMQVGLWTGLSRHDIESRFPEEWARLLAGEDLPRGGGETFAEFRGRIVAALDALRRRHAGETVAVITHGGAIRAALLHILGLPVAQLREIAFVLNTAITELHWGGERWEAVRHNDRPHLAVEAAA